MTRHRFASLALSCAVVLVTLAAAPAVSASADARPTRLALAPVPAAGTAYVEGIDVSHWQGTITWSKVAAAGKKFAMIKASESTDYVDPMYSTNRAAAQAAGMWTGAYHFARPSTSAGDAVAEADHFADTVKLGAGDLIPALDIEVTGGLSPSALTAWVTAWLNETAARTGVKPMVYTSPAFWQKYLADTRSIADLGYKVLWVAHWGVSQPTVPAQNWGGRGWTFWQYDNCGTVPGISGCVDLDRYNGTDLTLQAFSGFSLRAAGGQIKQGHVLATTVGISRTNFDAAVALDINGLPKGTTALWDASPTTGTSSNLRLVTDIASTPTGTYPLTVTGSANGQTSVAKLSLIVADGIPPTISAPSATLYRYTGLTSTVPVRVTWTSSDPSGVVSTALQHTFGSGTWTTDTLTSGSGIAGWSSAPLSGSFQERLRARDGADNRSDWSTGPSILSTVFQQNFSTIAYTGTWLGVGDRSASGGSLRYTRTAGSSATFSFVGSSVGWVAARGPGRGSAKVYVDGTYVATVALSESAFHPRQIVFAQNWATAGAHTLKIVSTSSSRVDVDAFVRLRIN